MIFGAGFPTRKVCAGRGGGGRFCLCRRPLATHYIALQVLDHQRRRRLTTEKILMPAVPLSSKCKRRPPHRHPAKQCKAGCQDTKERQCGRYPQRISYLASPDIYPRTSNIFSGVVDIHRIDIQVDRTSPTQVIETKTTISQNMLGESVDEANQSWQHNSSAPCYRKTFCRLLMMNRCGQSCPIKDPKK